MSTADLRQGVADAARLLATEGLLVGTGGNVSVRDGDCVAITGSSVVLARCTAEDITVVDLDGAVVEGRLVPSTELDLHLGIYHDTDADAVVHTHAPFATAIACVMDELPVVHYQQLLLGGAVRVAPYATFGTPELAAAVVAALEGRQAALMANHGAVTTGTTLEKAVEHALLLEWFAALHHRASLIGTPRPLTDSQQADVVTQALARNYGIPQENPHE